MPEVAETPEQEEPLTDVPESILRAAKEAPDHWFGMVDPAWRGEGVPPTWALVGQYRSSTEGEVVEWQYNDDYRPSPSAKGWPEPTDPVDEAVQLAATGYGPEEDVLRLLADAEVGVMTALDGRPVEALSPDGTPVVPLFTSEAQLRSGGRYAAHTVRVPDLVRELGEDTFLYVNPAGVVSMMVDPEDLVPRTTGGRAAAEDAAVEDLDAESPAADARAEVERAGEDEDVPVASVPSVSGLAVGEAPTPTPTSDGSAPALSAKRPSARDVETLDLPDFAPEPVGPEPEPEPGTQQAPRPASDHGPEVSGQDGDASNAQDDPGPENVSGPEGEKDSQLRGRSPEEGGSPLQRHLMNVLSGQDQ